MGLWWLQPGWGAARCSCGVNIQQAGGDPDMGVCPDCYESSRPVPVEEPSYEEPRYECDNCGCGSVVTTAKRFDGAVLYACSEECVMAIEAARPKEVP